MNVAVILRREKTIRITDDGLCGDSLWFRVIYHQYFRRKMLTHQSDGSQYLHLKTTPGQITCIFYWKNNIVCAVFLLEFFRF